MDRIVKKGLASFGVTKDGLPRFISDVFVPLVREIRRVINARFGEVVSVTSDYTITDKDEVVLVFVAGSVINVTLPPVIGWTKHIIVKRVGGSHNVVIAPNADDLANGVRIDTYTSVAIGIAARAMTFVSNGSNWYFVTQI